MPDLDTSFNSSFSALTPGLQLAVDSTSLGAYKTCPRKYFYSIVLGYQPRATSVHLTFGLLLHEARELYDHARADSLNHEDALALVVRNALSKTWVSELSRPWISDHKVKNRNSLLRTIIWYLDQFGDGDAVATTLLASGKPAVELSFQYDSGFSTQDGEAFLFCGHMDRIGTFNDETYIVDLKTTSHSLDAAWFGSFTPDNQFSMYTLAGKVVFDKPVRGLIVDGAQIGVGFSRFARGIVPRDADTVAEWHAETGIWLGRMEESARRGHWEMNDKSCSMYGGCEFRAVCSRSPSARAKWLEADYKKRIWDPMKKRGDV